MQAAALLLLAVTASSTTSTSTSTTSTPAGHGPLGVPPLDPHRCVTDEQIAAAARASNPEAFGDSAIPLGPLFWASRDRTFMQVMLVYWRYLGVEDRTKLEVTFPFWLSSCTPEADTTVGPLATFGWKTDDKGTAGYYGPYFFRRDDDAESDVLFPLYWHLLDKKGSTLILGNIFDVESDQGVSDFGVAPFYWGERSRNGRAWFDITPVFARWGDADKDEAHLWLLQTWANRTPSSWDVASWPLYFAGEDTRGNHYTVIPPLLAAHWGDGERETTLVGQSWFLDEGRGGWDAGSLPFYIGGRHGDSYYDLSPLFLRWGDRDGGTLLTLQTLVDWDANHWGVNSIPFYFGGESVFGGRYHHFIPPLFTFIWGDDEKKNLIAGPYWDLESPHRFDQGMFPVFARGADDVSSYFLTPLFGAWGDNKGESHVWVLQTLADVSERAHAWDVRSYPFYFGGEDGRGGYHHEVPLALTFIWGDPGHQNIVAGPWFDLAAGESHDAALLPLYFEGEVHGERPPVAQLVEGVARAFGGTDHMFGERFHYRVLPPLLYAHAGNDEIEDTLFLQSWLFRERDTASWDAGSFPLYAGGRHGDDYYDLTPLYLQWGDGRSFFRAVPLLYTSWGDKHRGRTLVLQSWFLDNDAAVDDEGEARWDAGSFPFYAGGRHGDGYYDLTPVFARWGDAEEQHLVAGPYFDIESSGGEDHGVFPLYFAGSAKSKIDGFHYRVIPLLYEHWGDAREENTLFLQSWLLRDERGYSAGSFPFYAGGGDDDGGFYHLTPVAALWGDKARTHLWALQTFAGFGDHRWDVESFPFYFGGADDDTGDYGHAILPALTFAWGGRSEHNLVAGPFYRFDRGIGDAAAAGFDEGLFPLYARGADAGGSYFGIPALLTLAWTHGAHDNLIAGPVFDFNGDDDENAHGLFPLYLAGQFGKDVHWRVAPPLLYGHVGIGAEKNDGADNDAGSFEGTIFAQSWWFRDRDSWNAGSFPFYAGGVSPDGYYQLTPLFSAWGDAKRTHIASLQTWAAWGEDRWDVESFPFYFGGADDDNGDYGHAVVPLLTAAWGNTHRHETNWWTAQTFVHVDEQAWSACSVPFYFGGGDGNAWHQIIPPLFFGWGDKAKDEDTEWLLPPAYMHWHTPNDDATLLLAYYARESQDGTSAHALAPVWFSGNDSERYWNVVAPAYFGWGTASHDEDRWLFLPTLTYGSRVNGEDWLLAPFVWHEKTAARDDTIVFPLWWSFNDDAGKALVVSGVWWDLQWPHEGKRLQLAPGYLRFEDAEEAFTIAGPLSWSEGRGDHKEAWSFHVFPLFSIWSYHPGHIRWRALIGAFGYEEEKTPQSTRREVMVMGLKFDPGG